MGGGREIKKIKHPQLDKDRLEDSTAKWRRQKTPTGSPARLSVIICLAGPAC